MEIAPNITTLLQYAPVWFVGYAIKYVERVIKRMLKSVIPGSVLQGSQTNRRSSVNAPLLGHVRFGDMRQLEPICDKSEYNREHSIDRYYINCFFVNNASDILGSVLEVGSNYYTVRYRSTGVNRSDVIYLEEADSVAKNTIVDLTKADHIASHTYDCIIFPQKLQYIYEMKKALVTLYRILKPSGVLLMTVPGISKNVKGKSDRNLLWSFTALSAQRLFEEVFPVSNITIETYGNVLTSTALMHGLPSSELTTDELNYKDPLYQIIISVRAIKP